MATAFQKVYTKISQITKATCSLKAQGVGYNELATIDGKLAQVVKIMGDDVTLQVFEGTGGIPTNAEVVFMGKSPSLKVSDSWPDVSSTPTVCPSTAALRWRARRWRLAARP